MDFPHVDERTEERFTRLWPRVSENEQLKAAAAEAPEMLKFARDKDGPHFRLYENRIPASVDADKAFSHWATQEAMEAAVAESKAYRDGKGVVSEMQQKEADAKYPEEVRYYPAMVTLEGQDKSERDRFNEIVETVAKARDLKRSDVVQYNASASIKAFVSKVGPIAELAEWQSDKSKELWAAEGKKLETGEKKEVSNAKSRVSDSAERGRGNHFLGDYGKGLMLPSSRFPKQRDAVVADIRAASTQDLVTARDASERGFKALEKKQYARQITAAQANDPKLTTEEFNKMDSAKRREAAGKAEEAGLPHDEFRRMVGLKNGFFALSNELRDRGEHMSVDQARDLKSKEEAKEKSKPVDEKGMGKKAETGKAADQSAAPKPSGRQSSKGAAAAADLARGLGR